MKKEKKVTQVTKPDVIEVTRRLLLGITPEDVDILDGLTDESRSARLKDAHTVNNLEVFNLAIKRLMAKQADFIACNAENWESVLVARGTLNGIAIVSEVFEELASKYEELIKPKKEINKYDII